MLQTTADSELEVSEVFTHDELVAALVAAQSDDIEDGDVMTGPELATALGISQKATMKRVKRLLQAGTIEVAIKRFVNVIGVRTSTRGYRLK